MQLGDAGASILLSPVVAVPLWVGWRVPLRVVMRAARTRVGDTLAGRNMLGLPMSTAVTGYRVHHTARGLERNCKIRKGVRKLGCDGRVDG